MANNNEQPFASLQAALHTVMECATGIGHTFSSALTHAALAAGAHAATQCSADKRSELKLYGKQDFSARRIASKCTDKGHSDGVVLTMEAVRCDQKQCVMDD